MIVPPDLPKVLCDMCAQQLSTVYTHTNLHAMPLPLLESLHHSCTVPVSELGTVVLLSILSRVC